MIVPQQQLSAVVVTLLLNLFQPNHAECKVGHWGPLPYGCAGALCHPAPKPSFIKASLQSCVINTMTTTGTWAGLCHGCGHNSSSCWQPDMQQFAESQCVKADQLCRSFIYSLHKPYHLKWGVACGEPVHVTDQASGWSMMKATPPRPCNMCPCGLHQFEGPLITPCLVSSFLFLRCSFASPQPGWLHSLQPSSSQ